MLQHALKMPWLSHMEMPVRVGFKLIGVRARYRFAVLVFCLNEFLFSFLSIYISPAFLVAALFVMLGCGIYMMNIKCPVCGKPVLYNPVNNLGIRMYAYTPTIPQNCSKCGAPLE